MEKSLKVLLIFSLLFFSFKIISIYFTSLGLHGDEAQYWAWSKHIDMGYFSKPPVLPILIRIFSIFFGDSVFGIKIVSIVIYFITSVGVFLLSKKLYNFKIALVCGISFFLLPGVSFSSFITSTDVPLLMFWTFSLYFLIIQIQNPNLLYSIILGTCLGLGFLSKYAMIFFFFSSVFYLYFDRNFYSQLIKNKKYYILTLFIFLIIVSPNLYWNIENDWLTFKHTADNASIKLERLNFIKFFEFVIAQIFIISPVLFFMSVFFYKRILILSKKNIFLLCYSVPIILLIMIESLLVRAHGNWAAVSYVTLTILLISNIFIARPNFILINNLINMLIGFLFFCLIITNHDIKIFEQLRGYKDFAKYIDEQCSELKIDNIVIQDRMILYLINYNLRSKDYNLYSPRNPGSAVAYHFQIKNSLPLNFNKDFLYIGSPNHVLYLENLFDKSLITEKNINSEAKKIEMYKFITD